FLVGKGPAVKVESQNILYKQKLLIFYNRNGFNLFTYESLPTGIHKSSRAIKKVTSLSSP
ncbi:MAG: hypothetical protein QOK83_08335, partial [Nitrososphaeraceae archaeon]|nr:hypothetical protein [Nitrososphaeraceae archaeon]